MPTGQFDRVAAAEKARKTRAKNKRLKLKAASDVASQDAKPKRRKKRRLPGTRAVTKAPGGNLDSCRNALAVLNEFFERLLT